MRRLVLLVGLAACSRERSSPAGALDCDAIPMDASHPDAAAIDALVTARVSEGLPGLMLTIDRPGIGAYHGAAGFADLGAGTPIAPCQLTRAGSINKTVTAAVVLQLVDEGVLGLDDPIAAHLPPDVVRGVPNADLATIRQALQHASGIPNWIWSLGFQTASLDDLERVWTADELLDFARRQPPAFEPGADVDYSNTNALLLGLLLENVTGEPLATLYDERVFAPIGLRTTRFAASEPVPDDLIRGYVDLRNNGQLLDGTRFNGWDVHADGGLLSDPAELTVLMRAMMDGTLVPPSLLEDVRGVRAPSTVDPEFFPIEYGLGVFRMETSTGTWWFHSGDAIGYWATALVREEDGVAVSWAVNGNYGTLDASVSSRSAWEDVLDLVGPP